MACYMQTLVDIELKWSEALDSMTQTMDLHQLSDVLSRSAELNRNHMRILEESLEEVKNRPFPAKAHAVRGIIYELNEVLRHIDDAELAASAILVFHEGISHLKLAMYRAVRSLAEQVGDVSIMRVLTPLLQEEEGGAEIIGNLVHSGFPPRTKSL